MGHRKSRHAPAHRAPHVANRVVRQALPARYRHRSRLRSEVHTLLGPREGRALFVLTSAALAATYVILNDGSSTQGLSLVAERTGLPYEDLVVLDLETRLQRGVPDADVCEAGPVTQESLAADLKRALQAYDTRNLVEARTRAESWGPATACLTERVDADWLWQAGFV